MLTLDQHTDLLYLDCSIYKVVPGSFLIVFNIGKIFTLLQINLMVLLTIHGTFNNSAKTLNYCIRQLMSMTLLKTIVYHSFFFKLQSLEKSKNKKVSVSTKWKAMSQLLIWTF